MSKVIPVHKVHRGWHFFRNRKALVQMIREVASRHYRMSFLTIGILIFSIAYIVFPYDLIPDRIVLVGWLDDAAALFFSLRRLVSETQRYIRFKAMERKAIATIR